MATNKIYLSEYWLPVSGLICGVQTQSLISCWKKRENNINLLFFLIAGCRQEVQLENQRSGPSAMTEEPYF